MQHFPVFERTLDSVVMEAANPAGLRHIIPVMGDLIEDAKVKRDIMVERQRGKPTSTYGCEGITEGWAPVAVHGMMEEKYGLKWFQDEKIWARFLRENPAYAIHEYGGRPK